MDKQMVIPGLETTKKVSVTKPRRRQTPNLESRLLALELEVYLLKVQLEKIRDD